MGDKPFKKVTVMTRQLGNHSAIGAEHNDEYTDKIFCSLTNMRPPSLFWHYSCFLEDQ